MSGLSNSISTSRAPVSRLNPTVSCAILVRVKPLRSTRAFVLAAHFLFAGLAVPSRAHALSADGEIDGCTYRLMVPDWMPRGEPVSVLIVVRNTSEELASLTARVELSPEWWSEPEDGRAARLSLSPGEVKRYAFRGIRSSIEAPAGDHLFRIRLHGGESETEVEHSARVQLIRGSAVERGWWSILVPAAIAVLSLPVFLLVLRREAKPGAWKRPVDAEIEAAEDRWWTAE